MDRHNTRFHVLVLSCPIDLSTTIIYVRVILADRQDLPRIIPLAIKLSNNSFSNPCSIEFFLVKCSNNFDWLSNS